MRGIPLLALAVVLAGCVGAPDDSTVPTQTNFTAPPVDKGSNVTSNATSNVTAPAAPIPRVELSVESVGLYPLTPAYEPAEMAVAAGSLVVLTYRNADLNPLGRHDWVLEGLSTARTEVIPVGQEETIEFAAPPAGTYAFYCSVEGHRERGMEGTFTVG